METVLKEATAALPGLNCGLCGYPTCNELWAQLAGKPHLIERCIHRGDKHRPDQLARNNAALSPPKTQDPDSCASSTRSLPAGTGHSCAGITGACATRTQHERAQWKDILDRDIDFYLEHFPEDPGPREVCLPHNPILTRELELRAGDIMIGRPLGMSCGCPITHCGIVKEVDMRTGVFTWCVTGPLQPRQQGYKDIGYYCAEAYEGLVKKSRITPTIGMRYFFQPTMCMLQWRHSGLVNYVNKLADGWQIRLEGLYIG